MHNSRILVVDDDRSNCVILSKLLSSQGYRVDWADNGQAALALAEQQPYGLVLLDYRMPEMDGVELYRRLRLIQPDLIGVFQTAFAKIEVIYAAIEAGAERVLAKPVDSRELLPLVERLVGNPLPASTHDPEPSIPSSAAESFSESAVPVASAEADETPLPMDLEQRMAHYAAAGREAIEGRLRELEAEKTETGAARAREVNAAMYAILGLSLGAAMTRKWMWIVTAATGGFLLQQAMQGTCLPIEMLRRLKQRPEKDLERERYALKALRGDFRDVSTAGDPQSAAKSVLRAVLR